MSQFDPFQTPESYLIWLLYQRPRLLTHFWDSQIGETLTRCLFTKEEQHRWVGRLRSHGLI